MDETQKTREKNQQRKSCGYPAKRLHARYAESGILHDPPLFSWILYDPQNFEQINFFEQSAANRFSLTHLLFFHMI